MPVGPCVIGCWKRWPSCTLPKPYDVRPRLNPFDPLDPLRCVTFESFTRLYASVFLREHTIRYREGTLYVSYRKSSYYTRQHHSLYGQREECWPTMFLTPTPDDFQGCNFASGGTWGGRQRRIHGASRKSKMLVPVRSTLLVPWLARLTALRNIAMGSDQSETLEAPIWICAQTTKNKHMARTQRFVKVNVDTFTL